MAYCGTATVHRSDASGGIMSEKEQTTVGDQIVRRLAEWGV